MGRRAEHPERFHPQSFCTVILYCALLDVLPFYSQMKRSGAHGSVGSRHRLGPLPRAQTPAGGRSCPPATFVWEQGLQHCRTRTWTWPTRRPDHLALGRVPGGKSITVVKRGSKETLKTTDWLSPLVRSVACDGARIKTGAGAGKGAAGSARVWHSPSAGVLWPSPHDC